MLNQYVYKNNQKLRYGYTTGSCAAAASKAAAIMFFTKKKISSISIMTPKGIPLNLEVLQSEIGKDYARCVIKKDAGDDPDVTDKILVYSTVKKSEEQKIEIHGGIGVGKVTKPGLDQEVGEAAINSVPRQMIYNEVRSVCEEAEYTKGLTVTISIPEGVEIAKKTYNPKLGIEGGISVLGTSGIVEPMSERALLDTIKAEISMVSARGEGYFIMAPGNYGQNFVEENLKKHADKIIKCSNFIGATIDMAFEYNIKGILLIGHIGKLVKLGAGIMNTHSREGDGRMDVLVSCALLAGADTELLKKILSCVTTDEALEYLKNAGCLEKTMEELMKRINYYLKNRGHDELLIGAIMFSNKYGLLGKTEDVDQIIKNL